ncbi:MAG: SAM-dependent methyltransferase [Hyphomicrobiaceae bacterium]
MSEQTAYLAPEGFLDDLLAELGPSVGEVHGRLVLTHRPEQPVAWAANVWRMPMRVPIASIGDAAKKLRAVQRNWSLYPHAHQRRAALIAERLPRVSAKPLDFGAPAPSAPLGSWTLLSHEEMLISPTCSSAFPNGEISFVEDRVSSPSRAYLKLWEALTLIGVRPGPGDLCLDLGASPGGWTWVIANLGARVISIDKAPLDPGIAAMEGVDVRRESAFGLQPGTLPPVDWLFSDVICYPARLLSLIERWIASGRARRFVCTVKFQGETDFLAIERFKAIPGSRLLHLHHNKHELTWIKL